MGGMVAGIGGAVFTIGKGHPHAVGITEGYGFIALAIMIFGRWRPWAALGRDPAVRVHDRARVQLNLYFNQLGVPSQFINALPYIITIAAVAGLVGVRPPAADGDPLLARVGSAQLPRTRATGSRGPRPPPRAAKRRRDVVALASLAARYAAGERVAGADGVGDRGRDAAARDELAPSRATTTAPPAAEREDDLASDGASARATSSGAVTAGEHLPLLQVREEEVEPRDELEELARSPSRAAGPRSSVDRPRRAAPTRTRAREPRGARRVVQQAVARDVDVVERRAEVERRAPHGRTKLEVRAAIREHRALAVGLDQRDDRARRRVAHLRRPRRRRRLRASSAAIAASPNGSAPDRADQRDVAPRPAPATRPGSPPSRPVRSRCATACPRRGRTARGPHEHVDHDVTDDRPRSSKVRVPCATRRHRQPGGDRRGDPGCERRVVEHERHVRRDARRPLTRSRSARGGTGSRPRPPTRISWASWRPVGEHPGV